jgi:putative NIF3 family GTP cyclohydrolase 1 type 2
MAKGVKMTESKFKAIKILLAGGATYKETAESMGVSTVVVGYCKHSETFEEYRHKIYMTSGGYRKKMAAEKKALAEKLEQKKQEQEKAELEIQASEPNVVEHRQTVTIQATHYMMEEMKKTNELLKLISSKLAFIVDELTK